MQNWYNYFLSSKDDRLTQGHLKASELYQKILTHKGATAYSCYFDLDYAKLKMEYWHGKFDSENKKVYIYFPQGVEPEDKEHYKPEITFTQYEGIARPAFNMVSFDFDADDPTDAIEDVRNFCTWLGVQDIAVFYSGSKGFHVMVPFGYFPLEANEHLPNQLKDLASLLKESYKTLDTSIYNYNRKFRVPFTKHEKSGRFKHFVPVEYLKSLTLETIIEQSEKRYSFDFLQDINPWNERKPLDIFVQAMEEVKRKSYAIEKDKAGTVEKPSKFEAYDGKLCIKKLLESRCDDVGRNNACIRIINDFYRTGKTRAAAEDVVYKWADTNGLPRHEAAAIMNNIYERGANYNFGCQDEIKSLYCSAKCSIWKKLDPDKRPATVDMPMTEATTVKQFNTIKEMLMKTFECKFDGFKCEFYGGLIVKQGKQDLFYYKDGYWQYLESPDEDKIKRRLNALTGNKLDSKKIEQFFKMFVIYVPSTPVGVDLFTPNSLCANFENGTLHLDEDANGSFSLNFRAHSYKDWITFKIPQNYNPESTRMNDRFEDLIDRAFKDSPDKENIRYALAEMFGAALIPYFPHLFYLYGKAHSGKSSIMLILRQLLGNSKNNISSVQPKDFNGFNLESMAGKLVNMVLDVNTRKPMEDDIVKQIEDRIPMTIRRKQRQDLIAPLPSIHIFSGNDLIPSYEGYSGAMKRRWTIFKFDHTFSGDRRRNYAGTVFNHDPEGILNFAIMGLKRLVENQGYFSQVESSTKALEKWGEESDVVGQFLDEACRGETDLHLVKQDGVKIERKILYMAFSEWQEKSGYKNRVMTKVELFKRMDEKGFEVQSSNGKRYFIGIGELTAQSLAASIPENKLNHI